MPSIRATQHRSVWRPLVTVVGAVALATSMLSLASPSAHADDAPCEPVLVTHSPEGATGNERAVAITAQALDRDVDGWINVAWEADPATELSAVTVTSLDGTTTTLTEQLRSGSAFDVLELRFCGTTELATDDEPGDEDPADGDGGDPGESDDERTNGDAPEEDTTRDGGGDASTGGGTSTSGGSTSTSTGSSASGSSGSSEAAGSSSSGSLGNAGSGDTDVAAGTDTGDDPSTSAPDAQPDDEADDVEEPADEPTDPADETPERDEGEDAEAVADEPETEVLGVQLVDDGGAGGGRALLIGLAVTLGLAAIATGGALWYRRGPV